MNYSGYELLWIFMICSFGGWGLEVAAAAIQRHKFINRGFVSSPVCPIYGVSAVAFAIFLPELKEHLFFLFLGGLIVASVIEYFTGLILERIFHRKWWDYSDKKIQLDGYICLETSIVWGILAVLCIWFFNPAICWLVEQIPDWIHLTTAWVLAVLLFIDYAGSVIAILGLKKNERISQITEELKKTSLILENALTRHIQKRMVKAYPAIDAANADGKTKGFAQGYSFYKMFVLFVVTSAIGDLVETIFMYMTTHKWVSRTSLVYGRLSVIWGMACVLFTMVLYQSRHKSSFQIFLMGTVLGGAFEYVCSVGSEIVFGAVFWDYSKIPFNLGGRINLLYCFFWGLAAVAWMKGLYPLLSNMIEKIPKKPGKIVCNLLIVFLVYDMLLSAMALTRYTERYQQLPPSNQIEEYLDEVFPDERMEEIYPYARFRV